MHLWLSSMAKGVVISLLAWLCGPLLLAVPRGELSETELRAILQRMEPAMWDNVPLPSTAQPSAQASGAGGSLLLPGGLPASKALLLGVSS